MDGVLNSVAVLLGLAAVFGYLNHRLLHLPMSIGLVVIALTASLAVLGLDAVFPALGIGADLKAALTEIDFSATLMEGMLSFLLFAGALHVDLTQLLARKGAISLLATLGVVISTVLVGTAMWAAMTWLGYPLPYGYCLVFGALIAPTDPVAVLGILRSAHVPPSLEAKIAGESLFNDGVGIVVFTILVALAVGGGHGDPAGIGDVLVLFVREAGGGIVLGLVAGYIAYRAMRSIDAYEIEVIITLALVTVTSRLADAWHTSGPLAMVVAGLLIGNHGARFAMSDTTRAHLTSFWSLTDEILNAVLFLLIGVEVLVIEAELNYLAAALIAIPVVLAARFVAVLVPVRTLALLRHDFTQGAIPILTWGGLRGGISVALALSLPASQEREAILAMTYGVVVFSIIAQGLTIGPLARRLTRGATETPMSE